MPGGADLGYVKKLNGAGNEQIKEYVESGGRYLGICAGAYYASKYLRFKDKFEVKGSRELEFFPGTSFGPTYKGFSPTVRSGAQAIKVIHELGEFPVYYNGGGSFANAHKFNTIKILAKYDTQDAAIVLSDVGLGKALLSGVHFEYQPVLSEHENHRLQHMDLNLIHQTTKRKQFTKVLFEELLKED